MTVSPDVLYLVVGSAFSIELELLDDRDEAEDLTGATILAFAVQTKYAGGDDILRVTTGFTISGNKVTVPVTQAKADALRIGRFVGGLKLQISTKDYLTDPFHVDITEATA